MKRRLLILLILGFLVTSTGCVAYFAFWSGPRRTPAYCYDCHAHPGWVRPHAKCNYYVFKVVSGGYYYRPIKAKHAEYVFTKYDNKVVRARQKEHEKYIEKHKKDKKAKKVKKPRGGR